MFTSPDTSSTPEDSSSLRAELANSREELNRADALLRSILQSRSWRLTAPLRYVAARLRTLSRSYSGGREGRNLTLNEKIIHKMKHDRRPILTTFADKLAAREYVERVLGPNYLAKLYCWGKDPSRLDFSALPRNFVFKVNHASGGVVVVWDGADLSETLPPPNGAFFRCCVHPDRLDRELLVEVAKSWLSLTFKGPQTPEWCYENIPPQFLVEELLLSEENVLPMDYKFFCFNGKPRWIQVDLDRYGTHTRNLYWPNWKLLPVEYKSPQAAQAVPRPPQLGEMLRLASKLSHPVDFVRVDLYLTTQGVIFGELTNYPGAGLSKMKPVEYETKLGKWWKIRP